MNTKTREKPKGLQRAGYRLAGLAGAFKFERARLLIDDATARPQETQIKKFKRAAKLLDIVCKKARASMSADPVEMMEASEMLVSTLSRIEKYYEDRGDIARMAQVYEEKAEAHDYLRIAFARLGKGAESEEQRDKMMEHFVKAEEAYGKTAEQYSDDIEFVILAHRKKSLMHNNLAGSYRMIGEEGKAGKHHFLAAKHMVATAEGLEKFGAPADQVLSRYHTADADLLDAVTSFIVHSKKLEETDPKGAAEALNNAADARDMVSFVNSRMAYLNIDRAGAHEAYMQSVDYDEGRRLRQRAHELLNDPPQTSES